MLHPLGSRIWCILFLRITSKEKRNKTWFFLFWFVIFKSNDPSAKDKVILKRFSDFELLYKTLAQIYGASALPAFPSAKKGFGGTPEMAPQLVALLNAAMQLREVLKVPKVRNKRTSIW